jgi:hypothetical protein
VEKGYPDRRGNVREYENDPNILYKLATSPITIILGGGSVAIDGSYRACEEDTDWSGGGDLTADVEVGGMVKAKVAG